MDHHSPLDEPPNPVEYGTLKSYGFGFLSSVILILVSYFLVSKSLMQGIVLDVTLVGLAFIQGFIQIFLFFNLNREPKPQWNITVFLFMLLVVVILVVGSLWIMYHLNYNLGAVKQ